MRRFAALLAPLLVVIPGAALASARQRAWSVSARAPAQFDVALTQLRFHVPAGTRRPVLHLRLAGPNGLDYVAAAEPIHQAKGSLIALVAVVNRRPRGSLAPDLASIRASARLSNALGRPRVTVATNVLSGGRGAVCSAQATGSMAAGSLRRLLAAGSPPPGFGARDTVAQAFDAACSRPVSHAFRAAVGTPAPVLVGPPGPKCPPCPPPPRDAGRPRPVCPVSCE